MFYYENINVRDILVHLTLPWPLSMIPSQQSLLYGILLKYTYHFWRFVIYVLLFFIYLFTYYKTGFQSQPQLKIVNNMAYLKIKKGRGFLKK